MKEKILLVDDDPNILEAYQRKLRSVLLVETAEGGHEGLRLIAERGPFAVVIADMQMPKMNGIEFLAKVKEQAPDTVRMMLTGNADIKTAIQAVNEGSIFRFLTKPCPSEVMGEALTAGIKQYRLVTAEKELLERTLSGSIELLVEILSWADPEAFGEALQLRGQVRTLARKLDATNRWEIELATLLSQIGCIAVPRDLLAKAGADEPLSDDEKDALVRIPAVGQELIARIPRLEPAARIILYQNKNYDGSGFPEDDVAGGDIPLGSRILKVLLDLRKLESEGVSKKEALARMQETAGRYDPHVVAAITLCVSPESPLELEAAELTEKTVSGLRVGDVLVTGVEGLDGLLLVGPGVEVTMALLVRLRHYAELAGIQEPIKIRRPTPEKQAQR